MVGHLSSSPCTISRSEGTVLLLLFDTVAALYSYLNERPNCFWHA